jgi:DNA-binding GntR family transcriptional regulator
MAPSHRLDRSRHAAPQVFETLRALIIGLEMTPGTVLSRADLAARFGISQTPVRDALIRLGEEGLVDIFPQHATVVSRIDVSAARQVHFLRRSIELEVVRTLALEAEPTLVGRLRGLVAAQAALADTTDYTQFVEADRAFHRAMYDAAGVPELWHLTRRMSGHIDRLRMLHLPASGKTRAVVRDHTRIVDAIERHDTAQAQERLREHLSGTLGRVEEICRKYPEYIAAEE